MTTYVFVAPKGEKIVIKTEDKLENIGQLKDLIEKEYGYQKNRTVIKLKKTEKNTLANDFCLEGRKEFFISNLYFSSIKKIKEVSQEGFKSTDPKRVEERGYNEQDDNDTSKEKKEKKPKDYDFEEEMKDAPVLDEELINEFLDMGYPKEIVIEACKKFTEYSEIQAYIEKKSYE